MRMSRLGPAPALWPDISAGCGLAPGREILFEFPEKIKRQADFTSPPLQVFADIAQRHLEADGRVGGYYCFCDSASPMMITAVPAIASGGSDSPSTRTETAAAMSGSL